MSDCLSCANLLPASLASCREPGVHKSTNLNMVPCQQNLSPWFTNSFSREEPMDHVTRPRDHARWSRCQGDLVQDARVASKPPCSDSSLSLSSGPLYVGRFTKAPVPSKTKCLLFRNVQCTTDVHVFSVAMYGHVHVHTGTYTKHKKA